MRRWVPVGVALLAGLAGCGDPNAVSPAAPASPQGAASPLAAHDTVVAAVGDIVCGTESRGLPCKDKQTAEVALAMKPDVVLTLGDLQYVNTECGSVGGCGASSPMADWLRRDLAANARTCTLAFWHEPLFSSGQNGGTPAVRPLWQILYEAGADVILNGHDHSYERFAPQAPSGSADPARGIRQFVVGTGGRNLTPFPAVQPNSELRDSSSFGVLQLRLHPTSYDWQFHAIPGMPLADRGVGLCH
jgi:hypothetical protein